MKRVLKRYLILFCLLLPACAGHPTSYLSDGNALYMQGRYDEALVEYAKAAMEEPDKHEYRMKIYETKSKAALLHYHKGQELLAGGDYKEAVSELIRASMLDPSLEGASQELKKAQRFLQIEELYLEAEQLFKGRDLKQAKDRLERILATDPENRRALELMDKVKRQQKVLLDGFELDVISTQPITLKFKDAALRDIFTIFSKLSGVNFIFDDDTPSRRVSILLEKATFSQALELLLKMNNLGKKVLNEKTIILYPKNVEKVRQYEDQIIQIFYLSNIDAKKTLNLLRTMLQLKKIYVHEELNALVIRDKPDVIKLAQQVITAADRADSEVVFDVEIVEVGHSDIVDLGPTLSTYSIGLGMSKDGENLVSDSLDGTNLVSSFSDLETLYTLPSVVFNFAKTLGDAEILANPKIRVKNREKAKVHIGTREPVVTTSTNGDLTYSNVQYVDVGVKLDVEPTIQLDESIVTKLGLEVSNVSSKEEIEASGTTVLTITTTNAQTTLTLKDGEQTIIGGLIRDDLKESVDTIPGLGDIPGLGKLFSGTSTEKVKLEILLSITPHVVKSRDVPSPDVATIWSGGENDFKVGPSFGAFAETLAPSKQKPARLAMLAAKDTPSSGLRPSALSSGTPKLFVKGPAVIKRGDIFSMTVDVAQADKVYGAPLQVVFDPEMLDFMSAKEGVFLGMNQQRTLFTSHGDVQAGRVHIANSQLGKSVGASGAGSLVNLVFRARRPGQTRVGIDNVELLDVEGRLLPVEIQGLSLRVD